MVTWCSAWHFRFKKEKKVLTIEDQIKMRIPLNWVLVLSCPLFCPAGSAWLTERPGWVWSDLVGLVRASTIQLQLLLSTLLNITTMGMEWQPHQVQHLLTKWVHRFIFFHSVQTYYIIPVKRLNLRLFETFEVKYDKSRLHCRESQRSEYLKQTTEIWAVGGREKSPWRTVVQHVVVVDS